jgi:hypothetical protein
MAGTGHLRGHGRTASISGGKLLSRRTLWIKARSSVPFMARGRDDAILRRSADGFLQD